MIQHKRYLLFLVDQWDAAGGWGDFEMASDQAGVLLGRARRSDRYCYEIIDLANDETFSSGRVRDIESLLPEEADDAQDAD